MAPMAPVPPTGWAPAPVAAQKPLPVDAITGGLAFHRLIFARRRRGWWTPIVTGLLGVAFYLILIVAQVIVYMLIASSDEELWQQILYISPDDPAAVLDLTSPFLLSMTLISLALMIPAYFFASWIVNGSKPGFISSVAGRLRWGWLFLCTAAAVVVMALATGLSMLLPAPEGGAGTVIAPADNPALWGSFVVLILFVPLQATAEEYIFRGYLMQAIGRWLRHPAFAILLPVPLFVMGHLYDIVGQLSVGAFAIAAGWLTWRTGGLEAAIALHVVNNLTAFLQGLAGWADISGEGAGWESLIFTLVLDLAFVGVVELLFRWRKLGRTVIVTPAGPPSAAPVHAAAVS